MEQRAPAWGVVRRLAVRAVRAVRPGNPAREGATQVEVERIRRQMLTRPPGMFQRTQLSPDVLSQDVKAIRNLYRDQGYLVVQVDPPRIRLSADGKAADVTLVIDEGEQYRFRDIGFGVVPGVAPERVAEWGSVARGDVFSRTALLAAESGLRAGLDGVGYPDAVVRGRVDLEPPHVDVEFEIETGSMARVAEIEIAGNYRTKNRVILRELRLDQGDLISRRGLLDTQHELYRLGIFRSVRLDHEPISDEHPEASRLTIRVEEAKPISLNIGAGFDTERGARGSVSVTHENVAGTNRTLSLQTFVSGIERRAQLVGREPRLFGLRLPATLTFFYQDAEEIGFNLLRRSGALRVDRELGPLWNGFLRYGLQNVDVTDVTDEGALEDETIEDLRLGDIGITLFRDTRDNPLQARNGAFFSINTQLFARPLLSEATFARTRINTAWTKTFRDRTSIATAVRIGVARPFGETLDVPISERFFAGGDSTVRGFARGRLGPKEDGRPIGGEAMFIFNQEFRYPIWRGLRGLLFYDAGNVYRFLDEFDPTDLRHVLGVGLRYLTPMGPLRLEYGRKLDREPGETKGELFFAFGTWF